MNKLGKRILAILLSLVLLAGILPAGVLAEGDAETRADYSGTPDYAARYPHGVLEFAAAQLDLEENGPAGELLLIRRGGLEGEVSVRLKAIDVNARFGEDYIVTVEGTDFAPDPEDTGSLIEGYLSETDIITSDTEDPEYLNLIGYTEPEALTREELETRREEAVGAVAEMLDITEEQAFSLLAGEPKAETPEETGEARREDVPEPGGGLCLRAARPA